MNLRNTFLELVIRIFGYFEIFILFGIQLYLVFTGLFEIDPRHYYDYATIISLVLVVGFLAILLKRAKFRVILRKYEWLFHLGTVLCVFLLITLLHGETLPYSSIPFALRFFIWVIYWSLLIICLLIMNMDKPSFTSYFKIKSPKKSILFIIAGIVAWSGFLILSTSIKNPVVLWEFSAVFHGTLIFISQTKEYTHIEAMEKSPDIKYSYEIVPLANSEEIKTKEKLMSDSQQLETSNTKLLFSKIIHRLNIFEYYNMARLVFQIFVLLAAWANLALIYRDNGRFPGEFSLYLEIFYNPWFYVGMVFALFIEGFRKPFLGDGLIAILVGLFLYDYQLFSGMIIGYIIVTQIFSLANLRPTMQAILLIINTAIIMLSIALFFAINDLYAFNADFIITFLYKGAPISYAIGCVLRIGNLLLDKFYFKQKKQDIKQNVREFIISKMNNTNFNSINIPNQQKIAITLLIGIVLSLFSPLIVVYGFSKGSPLVYNSGDRLYVNSTSGICGIPESNEYVQDLEDLGVKNIRFDFSWDKIEPTNDQWQWEYYDRYVENSRNHSIEIVGELNYGNIEIQETDSWCYVPENEIPLFLDYVNHTVRRYINEVYAWEIWNEPNHFDMWDGTNEEFFFLFNATRKLLLDIKDEFNATFLIVSCSTAFSWPSYFKQMFEANIMEGIDVLSIHPYNAMKKESTATVIKQNMEMAARYNYTGDIWITEIGSATDVVSLSSQPHERMGERAMKVFAIASSLGIDKVFWYNYRDSNSPDEAMYVLSQYGLLYKNETWKASAHAYHLFSEFCSYSILCPDLIKVSNNYVGEDITSLLYRKEDGTSALILWYDSTLYADGVAEIQLNLNANDDPILIYDINTGQEQSIEDGSILTVDTKPIMVTFKTDDFDNSVEIESTPAWQNAVILLLICGVPNIAILFLIRKNLFEK